MGRVGEWKKIELLESFPFGSQFIYIVLLSKSHLNFFAWFQAFTVLCFPLLHHQQLLPPSHQSKHQLILFLSSGFSLQLLYFMYYSTYALIVCIIIQFIVYLYIIQLYYYSTYFQRNLFMYDSSCLKDIRLWKAWHLFFSTERSRKNIFPSIHSSNMFFL